MRHTYGPSLSPNGDEIAFIVRGDEGFPYAVQAPLLPNGVGAERPVRIPVEGPVTRLMHSPDGRWLALEVAPLGTERSEIWLVTTDPSDSGATLVRSPGDARVSLVEWDGQHLAVAAFGADGVTEGRLVNPFTGEYRVLDRRADGMLVDAENGYSLMRVGPRGNRELLLNHPDGSWHPLLPPDPGSTVDEGIILPFTRGQEHPTLLVAGDWGANRRRLLHIVVREGTPEWSVFMASAGCDVEHAVVSRDGSTAAVTWSADGVSTLEIVVLGTDLHPASRQEVKLPGMVTSGLSITDDGSLLAVTAEGPNLAPCVDIISTRTGEIDSLDNVPDTHHEIELASRREQDQPHPARRTRDDTPDLLRYTARDGRELSGWLYRGLDPRGRRVRGRKQPVLLLFHGGPEGQSRPDHHDVISEVIGAGVSVFTPNIRGSAGYGRDFVHADDRYGRFAGITDVADTVAFLVGAEVADPERIVISGRSYGGFLTLMGLTQFPELFAGGICACGMSDLHTFYRDTEPWIASAAYPKYGYPIQDGELLGEFSPLSHADAVRAPVLFIHGRNDTNVPPSEMFQMRQRLAERGMYTDLLYFEDEGHEFVKRQNRALIGHRMVEFLGQCGLL
ncbi:Prolyl oligopeptidase family protein [Corynebacterium heidelbergense]|uniref:S9 family peptidase n=1 Tax=Corynebacterium heidelbergense TaxID=2055947 RepID=UPI00235A3629|nr:prolyl oligopeptidase family serine peptidase [Corynebacterium heidelbergense]WCZ36866.1 Prolyl oligopeptidase family protein [Corynebacterium heidelbergense]